MRRLAIPLTVLICLAAAAPAHAARARASVVGGSTASIADHPWQVAVLVRGEDPYVGFFCGGVVLDATHVATAAHCVYDDTTGEAEAPSSLAVLAGSSKLSPADAGAQLVDVSQASFDPSYDESGSGDDAGILKLSTPLTLGGDVQAATPASAPQAAGAAVTVSGWGDVNAEPDDSDPTNSSYPNTLRAAGLTLASSCGEFSDSTGTLVCTNTSAHDACYGDSGGPLTLTGSSTLVALVEGGAGCAAGHEGVFTRADAGSPTGAFLRTTPASAPISTGDPLLSGTAEPGHRLVCRPGGWSPSPTGYRYQFGYGSGSSAVALTQSTTTASYTVTQADAAAGRAIVCEVQARNSGGYGFADSNSVDARTAAVTAAPATPVGLSTTTVKDVKAPKATVFSKRCTATRCTLNVIVTDPKPSRGLKRLDAALRRRVAYRCRRHGKRATCHRTATRLIKTKPIGAGHYLVVVPRLKPAKYTLSLRAIDKAGHRQKTTTKVTLRGHKVKKQKKMKKKKKATR